MSAYADAVTALTPAAYYRMGEASGTAATDSSGNGNTGEYVGGVTLGTPGLLTGDPDTAVTLDGTSGYLDTNYDFDPAASFTLTTWIRFAAVGAWQVIISQDSGSPLLRIEASDTISTALPGTGISSSITLSADQTAFLALSYDATAHTVAFYLDGTQTDTHSCTAAVASGDLLVGVNPAGIGSFVDGVLDEVAVFESVLTAAQIADLYTVGTTEASNAHVYDGSEWVTGSRKVYDGSQWAAATTTATGT